MSPVSPSRPRDAAKAIDDFEWPPKADEVSIYELGPDPWQALQDASSEAFAARHRERPQPHQPRATEPAPKTMRKLAGVLTASAIVVTAAGWGLHAAMTRTGPVQSFHHPAPAAAAPATPPPITIVATYPVEPPRVTIDSAPAIDPTPANAATPVDAPIETAPTPGPPETAAPTSEPAAVDASTDAADAGIRNMLQRYAAGLDRRQDVHFDRCDIEASEARGSAVCVGTVRYVPGVGRAVEKEDPITWTFDLARSGEDWRVAGLTAR